MDSLPVRNIAESTMSSISTSLPKGRTPRQSHMMSANEGPMDIIAKVSGAVKGAKREDDATYFTNNEGHPIPRPGAQQDCRWNPYDV